MAKSAVHSSRIFLRREADAGAAGVTAPRALIGGLAGALPGEVSNRRSNIRAARFRIDFINRFIRANAVPHLIEFGCGAGRVMRQLRVNAYVGVEVSEAAMLSARRAAGDDRSRAIYQTCPAGMTAALTLAMDGLNRLTGDAEFNVFVRTLFQAARDYVVIYAADRAPAWAPAPISIHDRLISHTRRFFPSWELVAQLPSPYGVRGEGVPGNSAQGNSADRGDFFVYARCGSTCVLPLMPQL